MVLGPSAGGWVGGDHGSKAGLDGVVVTLQFPLVLLLVRRDERLVPVQRVITPAGGGQVGVIVT